MNKNQIISSSIQNLNNSNFIPPYLKPPQNSIFANCNSYNSSILTFAVKTTKKIKKRNYNELMESYKEKFNSLYKKENEELYKSLNENFQKKIYKINPNYKNFQNFPKNEKIILSLNEKKNKIEKNKEIKIQPKNNYIINDDIDDVEKDFMFEEKKDQKKYKLSKSYLYDEDPAFYSDLEDTKENSFSALNFSFDYPEISLDLSIKDKLITNAIELEKTFNRYFNVKTMPNKK